MTTRSYCMGFWELPENRKNSLQHYAGLLPGSLDLAAGETLFFFSDSPRVIDRVARFARERRIRFEPVTERIEDLPGWTLAGSLCRCCEAMHLDEYPGLEGPSREKGVNHYRRDLGLSGPDTYRKILSIWLSKVSLTAEIAREAGSATWIDASVSRFSGRRDNWDFRTVTLPRGRLSHYASRMTMLGFELPLNASVLSADAATWSEVEGLFRDAAARAARMPYGHDEETILADCVWRCPDLFQRIEDLPASRGTPLEVG